jgi:hypothetical protein
MPVEPRKGGISRTHAPKIARGGIRPRSAQHTRYGAYSPFLWLLELIRDPQLWDSSVADRELVGGRISPQPPAVVGAHPRPLRDSDGSCGICNGPLTPITCTHICNSCYLTSVTDKRCRPTPGLAFAMPVTNVDFW